MAEHASYLEGVRPGMPLSREQPLALELDSALPHCLIALGTQLLPEDGTVHREPDEINLLALRTGRNISAAGQRLKPNIPFLRWDPPLVKSNARSDPAGMLILLV